MTQMKIDAAVIEKVGGRKIEVKKLLDKLPDNEILDFHELAEKIGTTKASVKKILGADEMFQDYKFYGKGNVCFFGNKKFIALLRKEMTIEN